MSVLNRLARAASNYMRARMATAPSRSRTRHPSSSPVPSARSSGGGVARRPPTGNAPADDDDGDEYDDVQLLGRDSSYDEGDMQQLITKMRLVSSSNVYSYAFQSETQSMGILYVTFLESVPKAAGGDGTKGEGPGPTYAYYNFPVTKFRQFEAMAESSAGGAVWDYCRVRHSMFEHQHTYRLISVTGDYVPRKATAAGWKDRSIVAVGIGRRGARRSTLKQESKAFRRQLPKRNVAAPNRGEPNRGER